MCIGEAASVDRPKSRRGGWRPGAGRPRKIRPEPARPLVAIGNIVWLWQAAGDVLEPRAALVVAVDRPNDPETSVYLIPFDRVGALVSRHADFSSTADPRAKCWSWPAKARTTYDV
jgi:hypothetical protein